MSVAQTCASCGAELARDAREVLCPKCLLERGMRSNSGTAGLSAEDRTVIDSTPRHTDQSLATQIENPKSDIANPLGRRFGDYELVEEIARGGMGVVYKARQVSLNRTVAVKMILAGQLASEAQVTRFQIEAEAAANLQHPNIVAIHQVGEHGGQHYFSMDFVEGKNMAAVVREGPLSAIRAATYLKTICEAIQYAHQRGILHRDLKPANVLIDAADQPRVTDFGLAGRMEGDKRVAHGGGVMGTPAYMPPEQASGNRGTLGPASDVYSLGAILYELLTGRPPFKGETAQETLRQVLKNEPVRPRKLNPRVPVDLETICLRCLEKLPERRYYSARDLSEELGRFLNREPILSRKAGSIRRAISWNKRNPSALAGTAAMLFLGLFWLAYGLWAQNRFLVWEKTHRLASASFSPADILDVHGLANKLKHHNDEMSRHIRSRISIKMKRTLDEYGGSESDQGLLRNTLVRVLNKVIEGAPLFETKPFESLRLSPRTQQLLKAGPRPGTAIILNRLLLEDAYSAELMKNTGYSIYEYDSRTPLSREGRLVVVLLCAGLLIGLPLTRKGFDVYSKRRKRTGHPVPTSLLVAYGLFGTSGVAAAIFAMTCYVDATMPGTPGGSSVFGFFLGLFLYFLFFAAGCIWVGGQIVRDAIQEYQDGLTRSAAEIIAEFQQREQKQHVKAVGTRKRPSRLLWLGFVLFVIIPHLFFILTHPSVALVGVLSIGITSLGLWILARLKRFKKLTELRWINPDLYRQFARGNLADVDPQFQFNRGVKCFAGRDYSEALKWFQKAADKGFAPAQNNIGVIYDHGHGVPQDFSEAVGWYRRAAEQGHAQAQSNLALMYQHGRGVAQDYAEAAQWCRKAAEQGLGIAQNQLGVLYDNGHGVSQNHAEAVKWFRKAAEQGSPDAQCNLGVMYEKGRGVPEDLAEGVAWYRKADDQRLARAQFNLGLMYFHGKGVSQDYVEAIRFYRKAAVQGFLDAQMNLGWIYITGRGVPQNHAEAARWYQMAAEQGAANAQHILGLMFCKGEGVPQDLGDAAVWYRKAAEQSYPAAQHALGHCYEKGEGVVQDFAEALKWYRKAAEYGLAPAQNNLGILYAEGRGVLPNHIAAYKWFSLAVAQGYTAGLEMRDMLAQEMTPEQIAEAQRRVAEFSAKKPSPVT